MDLEPFNRINPCGYAGLEVVDMAALLGQIDFKKASERLLTNIQEVLKYTVIREATTNNQWPYHELMA